MTITRSLSTLLAITALALTASHAGLLFGQQSVALRVEALTVPPATQPLIQVVVQNRQDTVYQGQLSLTGPKSWRLSPTSQQLSVAAGQTVRVPFSIEQAGNVKANWYAFQVTATSAAGSAQVHEQEIFVASAPYFKPTVDGRIDDWQDAIPITFSTAGRSTRIATYWNRRRFAILVAVQEDNLIPYRKANTTRSFDAVQFALTPLQGEPSDTVSETAGRFEYLLVDAADGARCFQLARMETSCQDTQEIDSLEPLSCDDAQIVVRRVGEITYYECSLSFRSMRAAIRPSEGREFWMSVLVHDPDGTGLRDLGRAAGLWPSSKPAAAWSHWPGNAFDGAAPLPPKVRWGFCASKY